MQGTEQWGDGDPQGHQAQSKGTMGVQGMEQWGMQRTPRDTGGRAVGRWGHRGLSGGVMGAPRDVMQDTSYGAMGMLGDNRHPATG